MHTSPLTVLGFAGSLRRHSYNRGLLRAAAEVAPEDVRLDVFDLAGLPLYNADVEAEGDPEPVARFKVAIAAGDALLIASPEYNYSVPGVLKNAIDWASRPYLGGASVLLHKPVALMGAGGSAGSHRAQLVLRQSLIFTDSYVLPQPQVFLVDAKQRFDGEGNLLDDGAREAVRELLEALAGWARRLRASASDR